MFFPFKDYKKITWDSDTGGNKQAKYTLTERSLLIIEIPYTGAEYNGPGVGSAGTATASVEKNGTSSRIYYDARGGTGRSVLSGESGSAIADSGSIVYWAADRYSGSSPENITLHVYELISI